MQRERATPCTYVHAPRAETPVLRGGNKQTIIEKNIEPESTHDHIHKQEESGAMVFLLTEQRDLRDEIILLGQQNKETDERFYNMSESIKQMKDMQKQLDEGEERLQLQVQELRSMLNQIESECQKLTDSMRQEACQEEKREAQGMEVEKIADTSASLLESKRREKRALKLWDRLSESGSDVSPHTIALASVTSAALAEAQRRLALKT